MLSEQCRETADAVARDLVGMDHVRQEIWLDDIIARAYEKAVAEGDDPQLLVDFVRDFRIYVEHSIWKIERRAAHVRRSTK